MTKRYRDAQAIDAGASNPIAVINALKNALEECKAENMDSMQIRLDPAIQAIVHQLAHLTGTAYFDQTAYQNMVAVVEQRAQAEREAQRAQQLPPPPAEVKVDTLPAFGKKVVPVGWDKIEGD